MIYYSFKVRIYPNNKQKTLIDKTIGCNRLLYNVMLDERNKVYEELKNDKDKLYKELFIVTTPLSIALWLCTYIKRIDFGLFDLFQTNYYHHDIIGNIIMGVFVLQWISCIYLITKNMSDGIYKCFARWSKNCNGIYCAHWVILGYSMLVLEDAYGQVMLCIMALIIFILSDIIYIFLDKKKIRI